MRARNIIEKLLVESGPEIRTLKDAKKQLEGAEKAAALEAGCVWHFTDKPTCAIYKSEIRGVTWYWSTTHRCYQADRTLKAAIKAWHEVVEPSA